MKRGPRIMDGSPRRPCRTVLAVRVPDGVAAALDARAQADGLTAASVVRRTLVEAFNCEPQDVQPAPRFRRPKPAPTVEVQAMAALREAVGEAHGTARQVAGLDRSRGGARLDELDGAITRLVAAAARLDEWKDAMEASVD